MKYISEKFLESFASTAAGQTLGRIYKKSMKLAWNKKKEVRADRAYVLQLVRERKYKQAQIYLQKKGINRHWKYWLRDTEPITQKVAPVVAQKVAPIIKKDI